MFDLQKFQDTKFKENIAEVEIKELASFFPEGEKPIIKVKALTGGELAKVNEAIKLNRDMGALIEGLVSTNTPEKVEAIKETMGISENSPDDLVRRIAVLQAGCVEPEMSQEICVKLADSFPVQFWVLTDKILILTGAGKTLGE